MPRSSRGFQGRRLLVWRRWGWPRGQQNNPAQPPVERQLAPAVLFASILLSLSLPAFSFCLCRMMSCWQWTWTPARDSL